MAPKRKAGSESESEPSVESEASMDDFIDDADDSDFETSKKKVTAQRICLLCSSWWGQTARIRVILRRSFALMCLLYLNMR